MSKKEVAAFESWKERVNNVLTNTVDITVDSLADVQYYSFFTSGLTPLQAAQEAVNNEWGKKAPILQFIE